MSKILNIMKKNKITYLISMAIIILAVFFILDGLRTSGLLSNTISNAFIIVGINIILAVSLNLTTGYLGELTLGHAGFMSVGAFSGALITTYATQANPSMSEVGMFFIFILAMIIGGLIAALFGLIVGVPILRLRGDYLAIVTLAFGEIVRSVVTALKIKGPDGSQLLTGGRISYIPLMTNFALTYAVIVITIIVVRNIVKSRQGRAICSIRENYIASESVGINISKFKIMAFVVSAFFAGMAGVLYAHSISTIKAAQYDYNKSIEILVMVVLGGMGNIKGAIIAATIITLLPKVLLPIDKYRLVIYAIVLITMMILNSNAKFVAFKEKVFKKPDKLQKKGV